MQAAMWRQPWALLVLSLLLFGRAHADEEMSVNIYNQVADGLAVTVRCQSADDNLGRHILWPGQTWGFGFHVNFFKTTLFTCEFVDGIRHATFIAWKFSRSDANHPWCRQCEWYIRPDGFWRAEQGTPAQLMQYWQ